MVVAFPFVVVGENNKKEAATIFLKKNYHAEFIIMPLLATIMPT